MTEVAQNQCEHPLQESTTRTRQIQLISDIEQTIYAISHPQQNFIETVLVSKYTLKKIGSGVNLSLIHI